MGQTVNLLAYAFGGSNPSSPTQLTNFTSETHYEKRNPVGFLFCVLGAILFESDSSDRSDRSDSSDSSDQSD